ncbi:MAG TPA: hypothetical protein VG841_12380 [Caulobacterales bacterium]|nr:hypothetical protein [Caulobacterales bacterium]
MSVELWPPGKSASASSRFVRELSVAMTLYLVTLSAAALVLRMFHLPQWASVLVVLAAMAPAALMLRAFVHLLSGMDEMQRRIQCEALAVTAGVLGFVCFGYSFLEITGVAPALPHALFLVFPVLMLVWRVVLVFVVRRYQ